MTIIYVIIKLFDVKSAACHHYLIAMTLIKNLRILNRKRNLLKKELKLKFKLFREAKRWSIERSSNFELDSVKTILLIRNEGKMGDAIVSTCFLSSLHASGYAVDVLANKNNYFIFENNPNVRNVYLSGDVNQTSNAREVSHGIDESLLSILKFNQYDLLIDTAVWQTGLYMPKMIFDINPRSSLGFNKPSWMKQYTFNLPFDYKSKHIKNIYSDVLKLLKVRDINLDYEVFYPEAIDRDVENLGLFDEKYETILINLFAGHTDRDLSEEQLTELIIKLKNDNKNSKVIVIDHLNRLNPVNYPQAYVYHVPSVFHSVSAIKMSDLIITPDTAIVHISAAFNKKLIAIYQCIERNNVLWGPGYQNGHQLFSDEYIIKKDSSLVEKIMQKKSEALC